VAAVLMVFGVVGLSMLTASIAAMFFEDDERSAHRDGDAATSADILARLERIEALLERGVRDGWILPPAPLPEPERADQN
ncbi:MAG: hypothetical protein KDB21_01300, partial [Acidimicrobiales bacterium]|nr:hypothetical protein [Acidimicrobiales bacterium]